MANTKIQIKRTSVSGRTPNTTDPANSQYIDAGEFALNLADGVLYTSNGNGLITIGATQSSLSASSVSACTVTTTSVSATTISSGDITITNGISIGNSTVNSSINSTALFSGNSSVNTVVNTVFISVSNATTNSSLSPQIVFVGNSAANAQLNLVGGIRSINVVSYSLTAAGVATVQTQVNHGIILTPGYTTTLAGVKSMFDGRVLKITSIPTGNTFTFSFSATDLGSLSVSAVQRANGVQTYTTPSPHGLTAGQSVTITGVTVDTNRFNLTGTIASAPTTNTFTLLVSSLVNKTANLTIWTVAPITSSTPYFSTGTVQPTITIRTYPDHGYTNSFENVIFENITTPTSGLLPFSTVGNNYWSVTSTKNIYSANSLTNGIKRIYNYTANQVQLVSPPLISPMHGKSDGVWNGSQGTFNAGARMVLSYDIPLTALTSPGKITIGSIASTATNPATAKAVLDNPIHLSVSNSSSSVKVTPTSIYVGSGTTNVIIDATGTRFNKAGSILQTFVDGTGFTVSSLQSTDGAVDPDANSYFVNASILMLGNTTVSTLLTPNSIQSNTFYAIDSVSNVTINSSSISMGSGFYINNDSANFPGIVGIGSTLELAGGIGANGDVGSDGNILTSNGTGVYWSSAISANVNASTINASANVITPTLYGNVVGITLNASSNVITTNVYATTVNANLIGSTANLSISVNSAALTVGTTFIANSTSLYSAKPITANNEAGTAGIVLYSTVKTGAYYIGSGARMSAGAYNGIVAVDDSAIVYSNGSIGYGALSIVPWGSSGGIRLATSANSTTIGITGNTTITGFANVSTSVNSALLTVGSSFIANTTGAYHTGTINAVSHTIGSGFVANTTVLNSNTDINITVNNKKLTFATVNSSSNVYFIQQNDDNFVLYSTNTVYGSRAVFSIYANSATSNLNFAVRTWHAGGLTIPSGVTLLDSTGSQGTAGQVLTSNGGSNVYWSTVSGGGGGGSANAAAQYSWTNTHTFQANVSFNGSGIGLTSNTAAIYLGGITDANWKIGRNTGVLTKWIYSNNTIDIVTANSTNEGFTIGLVGSATYFETGYLGTYIANRVIVGNSSSNLTFNSTGFLGPVNATAFSVGSSFIANTTQVTISGIPLSANNSNGTSGQVLASNGTSVYWTNVGTPRVTAVASATSITPNCDNTDLVTQINTGVAGTLTINAPTGTPSDGQRLMFRIQSTNVQTLSFNAAYDASVDLALPTATSGASRYDYIGFMWNATQSKWNIVAKNFGF